MRKKTVPEFRAFPITLFDDKKRPLQVSFADVGEFLTLFDPLAQGVRLQSALNKDDPVGWNFALTEYDPTVWREKGIDLDSTITYTLPEQRPHCRRCFGYLGKIEFEKCFGVKYLARVARAMEKLQCSSAVWAFRPNRVFLAIPFAHDIVGTPDEISAQRQAVHDCVRKRLGLPVEEIALTYLPGGFMVSDVVEDQPLFELPGARRR